MTYTVRIVLYPDDKESLQELLDHDKIYTEFERESAELINDVTDYGMEFEEGKELVNVCKAAEDMRRHAIEKNSIEIARALLLLGKNTIDEISMTTNLPLDEVKSLAASMTK